MLSSDALSSGYLVLLCGGMGRIDPILRDFTGILRRLVVEVEGATWCVPGKCAQVPEGYTSTDGSGLVVLPILAAHMLKVDTSCFAEFGIPSWPSEVLWRYEVLRDERHIKFVRAFSFTFPLFRGLYILGYWDGVWVWDFCVIAGASCRACSALFLDLFSGLLGWGVGLGIRVCDCSREDSHLNYELHGLMGRGSVWDLRGEKGRRKIDGEFRDEMGELCPWSVRIVRGGFVLIDDWRCMRTLRPCCSMTKWRSQWVDMRNYLFGSEASLALMLIHFCLELNLCTFAGLATYHGSVLASFLPVGNLRVDCRCLWSDCSRVAP
ncbi:hypothetical protein Dimus_034780 [Dionaea muscipula]